MVDLRIEPDSARESSSCRDDDDWQLVDQAIGNLQAFEFLFSRYWEAIYRYCYFRLGNIEDAEDAAIEILTNAFGSLARLSNQGATFRSWLFTIAHNEIVDFHRRSSRSPQMSLRESADRIDSGPTPEELALSSSEAAATRRLVAQLPDRPRQVVELRLAGLTDSEIAQVLDMSNGAVRQAQFRAIVQLRELMKVQSPGGRSTND